MIPEIPNTFTLKWTSGPTMDISYLSADTFDDCVAPLFNLQYFSIRLFFNGKEIPMQMTVKGAGVKRGSTVIVLQRKRNIIKTENTTNVIKKTSKKEIMQSVCAKKVDEYFRALEMNPSTQVSFQKALDYQRKEMAMKETDIEDHNTVISYTRSIRNDPLDFHFNDNHLEKSSSLKNECCEPYVRIGRKRRSSNQC